MKHLKQSNKQLRHANWLAVLSTLDLGKRYLLNNAIKNWIIRDIDLWLQPYDEPVWK